MRAFTLVELILVIAILAFLIGVSVPLAVDFYNLRSLDVQGQGIVQALRKAQLKAMSVEGDFAFGVHFDSGQYVLFKGGSYSPDDPYNEVFDLPDNLQVSAPPDIIFSKLTGIPFATGIITLTVGNRTETIEINEVGRVNYY